MAAANCACVAIAHRQELVGQMSRALARNGVRHRIIASEKVVRQIVESHVLDIGENLYDSNSSVAVASVDTLIRRADELADWLPTVRLWVQDEAHHVLKKNKWGRAVSMFPSARGLALLQRRFVPTAPDLVFMLMVFLIR